MTEAQLLDLFRRALKTSLALQLVACSASSSVAPSPDGATDGPSKRDTGTPPHDSSDDGPAPGTDAGHDSGSAIDGGADGTLGPEPCGVVPGECEEVLPLSCVTSILGPDASGIQPAPLCARACTPTYAKPQCDLACRKDGGTFGACAQGDTPILLCENQAGHCNGRAFAGMAPPVAPGQATVLGRYLAETVELEAGAIDAFRILANELRAHGAPDALVHAAEAAAKDEVRHARDVRTLARRHGPPATLRRAGRRSVRPLEEVALENAVEGCVKETYAALLAHHQASAAQDPEIQAVMVPIAADETRHAALSWAVARWAERLLAAAGRARVEAAREAAARDLAEAVLHAVPTTLTRDAGLPDAASASRMVGVLAAALWSPASPAAKPLDRRG